MASTSTRPPSVRQRRDRRPGSRRRLGARTALASVVVGTLVLSVTVGVQLARPGGAASAAPLPQSVVGLSSGSSGESVAAVQRALIAAGVDVPGGADGLFGPATARAVTTFQKARGLSATGTVDQATASALGLSSGGGGSLVGLQEGAKGPAVTELQVGLRRLGAYVPDSTNGYFGPATTRAVGNVQAWNQLERTGTVTPALAKLIASGVAGHNVASTGGSPSTSTGGLRVSSGDGYVGLRIGATGDRVKVLQRALIATGLRLRGGADGVFGPATEGTLREYQRRNGQSETGVVSSSDARLLALGSGGNATAVRTYPQFGERSARVASLQQALMNAGVKVPGGADGVFGPSTAGAVMEYQRRRDLSVSGRVDDATAARLGISASATPRPGSGGPTGARSLSISVFPVQGWCNYGDTWHAPRHGGRLHVGVDIIARQGNYVYAVADGTITKRFWDYPGSLAGNGLRLTRADGTYFVYLHLLDAAPGIGPGTKVRAGQIIGVIGSTGSSATPHLHFEIHPGGGAAVNPYPIVKAIDACKVTKPLPQP